MTHLIQMHDVNAEPLIKSISAVPELRPAPHEFSEQLILRFPVEAHVLIGAAATKLTPLSYRAGEMVLCRRDVREWTQWQAPSRFQALAVPEEALRRASEEHDLADWSIEPSPRLANPTVSSLFQALEIEESQTSAIDSLFYESITQAIATVLVRTRTIVRAKCIPGQGALAPWQLRRTLEYVESRLTGTLSIKGIAAEAQLSPVYFAQRFRQSMGLSPHAYVMKKRIDRSIQLLSKEPRSSVLDIALSCGFKTQQHFARVFRRYTSVSPTEFMRSR